jgi:Protein of unknown function (DUF3617)
MSLLSHFRRWLAAASFAVAAASLAQAQEPAAGVLWETTAQAEIPGMPMKLPAYTAKYCSKEEWTKPPDTSKDASQNCRHTSFEQTPAKVTWTMTCDNPPMTGNGEINFNGTDAYTGFVKMDAEQMSMQINLTGKKIGTCDDPE